MIETGGFAQLTVAAWDDGAGARGTVAAQKATEAWPGSGVRTTDGGRLAHALAFRRRGRGRGRGPLRRAVLSPRVGDGGGPGWTTVESR
jgi:hypothetical protein